MVLQKAGLLYIAFFWETAVQNTMGGFITGNLHKNRCPDAHGSFLNRFILSVALMGENAGPSTSLWVPDKAPSGSEGSAVLCLSILSMLPNPHQHYNRVVKLNHCLLL